ncbi:MAG: helix-turn-helix transcriptional regulator [Eubacterium sp.]|nr:helix-turn-helix transcriptional regulator [Eubacterium sp.]
MAIKYKIDILTELKNKGFSSYRIRKEKLFGESTLQKIRQNELVSWENIDKICALLECQPGDLIEYVND